MVGKGWLLAGNLQVGDKLLLHSDEIVEINKLEIVPLEKPIKVYNFEVEDWHTYFVSKINVLVHNKAMKAKKGKEFRGGSKKDRDRWYGYDEEY